MSSLSSRGGGRDEVIEVQCAPLPYHRSHQYYPRPPHPPAVHVVLLQFLIQSLSWEVIPEALGVSLKTTCRSVRVDFNQSQRWSWKPARKVGLMTSGEKHPSPSQSFHVLIYVLGGGGGGEKRIKAMFIACTVIKNNTATICCIFNKNRSACVILSVPLSDQVSNLVGTFKVWKMCSC